MKNDKLEKTHLIISTIQVFALIFVCCIGMYMTAKELYWQILYIIPCYAIILFGIIKLNKKLLK